MDFSAKEIWTKSNNVHFVCVCLCRRNWTMSSATRDQHTQAYNIRTNTYTHTAQLLGRRFFFRQPKQLWNSKWNLPSSQSILAAICFCFSVASLFLVYIHRYFLIFFSHFSSLFFNQFFLSAQKRIAHVLFVWVFPFHRFERFLQTQIIRWYFFLSIAFSLFSPNRRKELKLS